MNVILSIYTEQESALKINNEFTSKFKIEKGTKQGCPLSPLMSILVLEVLLHEIQEDKNTERMKVKGFSNKYRAFSDDVMFILENPTDTCLYC